MGFFERRWRYRGQSKNDSIKAKATIRNFTIDDEQHQAALKKAGQHDTVSGIINARNIGPSGGILFKKEKDLEKLDQDRKALCGQLSTIKVNLRLLRADQQNPPNNNQWPR